MFCVECGTKIQDDAKFCHVCGAKVNSILQHETHSNQNIPPESTTLEQETTQDFYHPIFDDFKILGQSNLVYFGDNLNYTLLEPFLTKSGFNIGLEIPILFVDYSETGDKTKGFLFTSKTISYYETYFTKFCYPIENIVKVNYGNFIQSLKFDFLDVELSQRNKIEETSFYVIPVRTELNPQALLRIIAFLQIINPRIHLYFEKDKPEGDKANFDQTNPMDYYVKKEIDSQLRCPRCGSTNININKKGISPLKAATGFVITGGIGLLAGLIGKNKLILTCLICGHKWKVN